MHIQFSNLLIVSRKVLITIFKLWTEVFLLMWMWSRILFLNFTLNSYYILKIFSKFISNFMSQNVFQCFLHNYLFYFLIFLQILSYDFHLHIILYTDLLYFVQVNFYNLLYILYIILYVNKLYNFRFSLSSVIGSQWYD